MEQNSNNESEKQEPRQDKINTLIILGNGYDLSNGYTTSYNDFIKSELFAKGRTDNDLFWLISQKDEYENWSDLEALLYIHAKDLERKFLEVALPDNGLSPLPKKGEAGQLITDFKKEYEKLHDGLCVFLNEARDTKKTKDIFEDYTTEQLYHIYQRSLPGFDKKENKYEINKENKTEKYMPFQDIDDILNKANYENSYNGITKGYLAIKKQAMAKNEAMAKLDELENSIKQMNTFYSEIKKTLIQEMETVTHSNNDVVKIILNHIKTIAEDAMNLLAKLLQTIQKARKGSQDSINKYIEKVYSKIDNELIKITKFRSVNENLTEIYALFQNKEKKIKDFNNEQKEILRIIVAIDSHYRRSSFNKVQIGWGNHCDSDSHILTFNYTPLQECTKEYVHVNEDHVIYVHGRLNNPDGKPENKPKNSKIVLGIDENMKVHRAFNFLHKSYQEGLNIVNLSDILQNARRFIIYGCSIGSTDRWYFEQIFMDKEGHITKGRVFEIYFYNDDAKESIQDCITNIVGNLMEFQTKNFVKWIRVEGTGLQYASSQREFWDRDELIYLRPITQTAPEEEENPASPR